MGAPAASRGLGRRLAWLAILAALKFLVRIGLDAGLIASDLGLRVVQGLPAPM